VGKNYRKIADFSQIFQQFLCHCVETEDRLSGNRGITGVNLMSGAGMSNMDMANGMFMIEVMSYYPLVLRLSLGVDLPWILSGLIKFFLSLCPKNIRNKVKIISMNELGEYYDAEDIPTTFGGNLEISHTYIDEMSALYECKHLGFSDKQIDNFYEVYKDLFDYKN